MVIYKKLLSFLVRINENGVDIMKKLIIAFLLIMSSTASAAGISLGVFDNKEYILQPDSVRLCSTPSCLFIDGYPQSYVAANILVSSGTSLQSGDALSYNKQEAYSLKSVLFAADGSRFVLVRTTSFDINGNPISSKNETEELKTFVSTSHSLTTDSKGNASTTREAEDRMVRTILWSVPQPGSAGEKITVAVLGFAESNYYEILARSKTENSISVK